MSDAHIQDTIHRIYNLRNTFVARVVDRQVLSCLARELVKLLDDYDQWETEDLQSLLEKTMPVLGDRYASDYKITWFLRNGVNSDDN